MTATIPATYSTVEPILIEDLRCLQAMVDQYRDLPGDVAFDIETTGLDPRKDLFVMLQFQKEGCRPVAVDMRRLYEGDVGDILRSLFDQQTILGMNLTFDLGFMHRIGVRAKRVYDVMIADQIIMGLGKSSAAKSGVSFHLIDIAERRCGTRISKQETMWFVDLNLREDEWNAPFPESQLRYGSQDVTILHEIKAKQMPELAARGLTTVAKIEFSCLPVIVDIENKGLLVDVDKWRAVIAKKEEEAREAEEEALSILGPPILEYRARRFDAESQEYLAWEAEKKGYEADLRVSWETFHQEVVKWGAFKTEQMRTWREDHPNPGRPKIDSSPPNLGSVVQLQIAFRALGIEVESTSTDALEAYLEYPAVSALFRFRKAQKFVDSFGESLLAKRSPVTCRIHPKVVQIGADTGRMSYTDPNFQQIPSKGDGKLLREAVIAAPGNVILTADFSNIELRIVAEVSRDPNMLRFFRRGLDLHSETAKVMFGLDPDVDPKHALVPGTEVTYRFVAKTINFGLIYGMSANKLSRTLHIEKARAEELLAAYFNLYPGVRKWLNKQKQAVHETHASWTLAKRARYYTVPLMPTRYEGEDYQEYRERLYDWRGLVSQMERRATNSPIQGTSADITKLALVLVSRKLPPDAWIIAVVHDEIVVECAETVTKRAKRALEEGMHEAALRFLKVVTMPAPVAVVDTHWSKE